MPILGQNLGLGEITNDDDIIAAAKAGCRGTRLVSRWLGNESGDGYGEVYQEDFFDDSQPHNVKPEKVAMLVHQATLARANGNVIYLGMDSDQLQGRMGGLSAFNTEGVKRRHQHINLGRFWCWKLKPDYIEPIVEPQGPDVTVEKLQAYQEEFMVRALEVHPRAKFLLGGEAYAAMAADKIWNPAWAARNFNITLTANFQSDLVCNEWMFEDRLKFILGVRDRLGLPFAVQQIWSEPIHDPDGVLLAKAIRALAVEGIDSLVWTACSRFKGGPNDGKGGTALRYLADPNDPKSEHLYYPERWANVTKVWQEFA